MDKTSWIVVIICMALLVFYRPIIDRFYPPDPNAISEQRQSQSPAVQPSSTAQPEEPSFRPLAKTAKLEEGLAEEHRPLLSNGFFTAEFTTYGGAVRRVILKKHAADGNERVILNNGGKLPMLNLSGWVGDVTVMGFEIAEHTPKAIVFSKKLGEGLQIVRRYTLLKNYSIQLEQKVVNTTDQAAKVSPYWLQVGLGAPAYLKPTMRRYIGGAWFTTNGQYKAHALPTFDDGKFLFLWPTKGRLFVDSKSGELIRWTAAKSQFFTVILSALDEPGMGADLRKVSLTDLHVEGGWIPDAVQAQMQMPGFTVPAGGAVAQKFNLYAGPKQDSLLAALPFEQNRVMEFGWLGWICRPMLAVMSFINKYVHNYGVTIIILTILIKAALWIPQTRSNQSMRKMQLLSPMLKELQDKYAADNPQKLQEEMMKLYKEYNVNPLGGCIPLLVQMPIFIGFYYMLLSAVELRHATFLWIHDLSQPDTVANLPIFGLEIPINPMPLIMTATMFWTMNITPQPKGVDNPTLKMMKFMPLVILLICYNFGAALSLYWTVQNILSAIQMYYNLKQPMPKLEKVATAAPVPKLHSKDQGFFSTLHKASQETAKKGKKKKRRK